MRAWKPTGSDARQTLKTPSGNKDQMDNQRLLIWGVFGLMVWFTYQAWIRDYAPVEPLPATTAIEQQKDVSTATDAELPALPGLDEPATATALDAPPAIAPTLEAAPEATSDTSDPVVIVRTDVLELEISTRGVTLQRATLLRYPIAKDQPDTLVELLSPRADDIGLVQTGLNSRGEGDKPSHQALFTSGARLYELNGSDEIAVPFMWTNEEGLRVEKTIRLRRGSYIIDIEQRIINGSAKEWQGAAYAQLLRRAKEVERSMFDVDTYSYDGPVIYDGEKSSKLKHDDLMDDGPVSFASDAGWLASIQHHFLTAVVPPAGTEQRYHISMHGDRSLASAIGPTRTVAPGADAVFETTVFVGPKLQAQLEQVDPKLTLTVDYGWLTIISEPLFWLLSKVFGLVSNWGLAIILVTAMIKAAFYKLTQASGRSMAKMREIQPRMKALQDRYKDDRPALSQAMMDLYKREKVNPAAGCLPVLVQMPFFLAFYWVLLESVEMRQAPFMLWITDLSTRDPYFILPIIMGGAMLFQQRLNPAPADPIQAKVMQVMPIVFTGFFAFFPSGLVLYWVTNTVLSIAQQWRINEIVAAENKKKKKGGGKKKEKKKKSE